MSKELPKVFANKINKEINNNSMYSVNKDNIINKDNVIIDDNKIYIDSVKQKINNIFSSYRYVYKADVIIKTKNGEIIRKVIGRNGNNLITMDNELIDINNILDIEFREK